MALLPKWETLHEKVESFRCYTMGAIVMAVVLGITGYFLTRWIWDIVMWVVERRRRLRLEAERAAMEKRALGK